MSTNYSQYHYDRASEERYLRRSQKRRAKRELLRTIGPCAIMASGGLLQGAAHYPHPTDGIFEFSDESDLCLALSRTDRNLLLKKVTRGQWRRMKKAFSGFCNGIVLVLDDPNDPELLRGIYELKLWFIKVGIYNPDIAIKYLKSLSSVCLYTAFGSPLEDLEGHTMWPGCDRKGRVTDGIAYLQFFRGEIAWIGTLFNEVLHGRPIGKLSYRQYYVLTQIAVCKRALPFPSQKEIKSAVSATLNTVKTEKKLPMDAFVTYRHAARMLGSTYYGNLNSRSHVSVTASASFELSRSDGGRAKYVYSEYKHVFDSYDFKSVVGCHDFLGRLILPDGRDYSRFSFGDCAYYDSCTHSVASYDEEYSLVRGSKYLGPNSGYLILACASKDMMHWGTFSPPPIGTEPVPHWAPGTDVQFTLDRPVASRGALSIESASKTRVVTACPSWFVTLFQTIRHPVMDALSKDLALILGFTENFKLWELSRKLSQVYDYVTSADCKDSTYNIPFGVLRANNGVWEDWLGHLPIWDIVSDILDKPERLFLWTESVADQYGFSKEPFRTVNGSFMGEPLSFINLTMMINTSAFIAACMVGYEDDHKCPELKFPDLPDGCISLRYKRPLMQVAGDDFIAFSTKRFHDAFYQVMESLGNVLPLEKNGGSKYYGTFCETSICVSDELDKVKHQDHLKGYLYVDVIKGRILNGLSKVRGGMGDPCLGHAMSLNRTVKWLPDNMSRRAFALYWANNPRIWGLRHCGAELPPTFGGFSLPRGGRVYDIGVNQYLDELIEYIVAILELPILEQLKYSLMLRSISSYANKGVALEGSFTRLEYLLNGDKWDGEPISILSLDDLGYDADLSWRSKTSLAKADGFIPLSRLESWLIRLESFSKLLRGSTKKQSYLVLDRDRLTSQFNRVWREIKRNVVPKTDHDFKSVDKLQRAWQIRLNGTYVSKNEITSRIGGSAFNVDLNPEIPLGPQPKMYPLHLELSPDRWETILTKSDVTESKTS